MNRVLAIAWQFALAALGFGAAAFVASLFINLADIPSPADLDRSEFGRELVLSAIGTVFVGYLAFVPACIAIAIAELLGRRDWLFHALGGGAVALAAAIMRAGASGTVPFADASQLAILVAAGLLAGLAYWLVAGRRSGLWQEAPRRAPREGAGPT